MYSYSRSKGIFGGVSLKGTVIKPNLDYNEEYYKSKLTPQEIMMAGKIKRLPASSVRLLKYMNRIAPPMTARAEKKEYKRWQDNPKYGLNQPKAKVVAENKVLQKSKPKLKTSPKSQLKKKKPTPLW